MVDDFVDDDVVDDDVADDDDADDGEEKENEEEVDISHLIDLESQVLLLLRCFQTLPVHI